jgi:hypothetical protein
MVSYSLVSRALPAGRPIIYGSLNDYTTVGNAYVEVGEVETIGMVKKRFQFTATTKDLTVKLTGHLDPTATATAVTIGEFTILAGDTHVVLVETMYGAIMVDVKPTVAGQHGKLTTYYYMDATEHVPVRQSFAKESITVTNAAAIGFTRDTLDSALEVLVTVEDNPIRVWYDGSTPTTAVGHLLSAGDSILLTGGISALNFLAIATGANATLRVTYSR